MKYVPVNLLAVLFERMKPTPAQEADELRIETPLGTFTVRIDDKTGGLEVRSTSDIIDVHPLAENCIAIVTRR